MFVLCDWRCNIVKIIGIWYTSAKSESSIYFRILSYGKVWTEANCLLRFINFDQIIIHAKYNLCLNNYGNVHNKQNNDIRMHTK